MRDSRGRATIQDLIGQARKGDGLVEYEWRKPSSASLAPKLGYVTSLPRWNWMLGTGLYLDDVETAMQALQRQVSDNVTTTMLWIAAIAAGCLGVVSAGGLLLNLSEHRVAEAKLRLLARQVVRSQEDERGHLARELHDGISQTLVSAKLLIESAVEGMERARQVAPPAMSKALLRLNDSLVEVRRISHRLRPALLDTLGLPAALEHLGTEFGEAGAPAVEVRIEGVPVELPEEVNTALFRIAQEALTNVHKHAQARRVVMSLAFNRAHVQLEVRDDGIGFDEATLNLDPRRGIGLRNMRERMGAIGCTLDVHTGGRGTSIVAKAPVTIVRMDRPT
jgi:two-component system NarL family sensor kinase